MHIAPTPPRTHQIPNLVHPSNPNNNNPKINDFDNSLIDEGREMVKRFLWKNIRCIWFGLMDNDDNVNLKSGEHDTRNEWRWQTDKCLHIPTKSAHSRS